MPRCLILTNQLFLHNNSMKKILSLSLILMITLSAYGETFEGGVSERGSAQHSSRIIDKDTGRGIGGAKITLPKQNYQTKTNKDGYFELDTTINSPSIISVEKDKYKPYTMTIDKDSASKPLVVGIEKSSAADISIDLNMHHLGDNTYSELSANAEEFRGDSTGPFYTKNFMLRNINLSKPVYLVIGSIMGIDTLMARTMGQNKYPNSYASPPEVYFNGNKIAEIQINGDGQKIKIPSSLVKKNQQNEVTIKTGRNLMQTSYVDYDDIEFMNLMIEN